MLTEILIRDFAIIDALALELMPGMTTLTGETGAGKSILIDAIGLVLGDRADSTAVRNGARRADLQLRVDLRALPLAQNWLAEHNLDDDTDCHLRRVISADGRSKAYINNNPCNVQGLRTFGQMLVDIHGQHEHHSLMQRDQQLSLLDNYLDQTDLIAAVAAHHRHWHTLQRRQRDYGEHHEQRRLRLDLLRFQVSELSDANLSPTELDELDNELRRLSHAEQLLASTQAAYRALYEDDDWSLHSLIQRTTRQLEPAATLDSRLTDAISLLNEANIHIDEAAVRLRLYSEDLHVDPDRLAFVERRLALYQDLARKHRIEPSALPNHALSLSQELAHLEAADQACEQLRPQLNRAESTYREAAAALSSRRQNAAAELSARISTAMQTLGMEGGEFAIRLTHHADAAPTPKGNDSVEFRVSANPGQPPKPLAKVASGGELARISLAIQMIAAHATPIPTLIFDEVDSGIGGRIAEIVGQQLAGLGNTRQVLCVTHLPQVAAQADHHFLVSKQPQATGPLTRIHALDTVARVDEIARMLGGIELTAATHAHAQDMLNRSRRSKGKARQR